MSLWLWVGAWVDWNGACGLWIDASGSMWIIACDCEGERERRFQPRGAEGGNGVNGERERESFRWVKKRELINNKKSEKNII